MPWLRNRRSAAGQLVVDRSGPRRPRRSSGSWPGGGSGRSCRRASRPRLPSRVAPSECDASAMIVSGPPGARVGDRPQRRRSRPGDRRSRPAGSPCVRGVIAAATRPGSMSSVPGSTSAKRDLGAGVQDGVGGRRERHRRGDRLVARPETGRHRGAMERRRPRREGDGVTRAGRLDEARLERRDARAGRQPVGAERGRDRLDVVVGDLLVGVRQEASCGRASPPSMASVSCRSWSSRRLRSGDRQPEGQPFGHPGARRGRGPRSSGTSGAQPSSSRGLARIAAQDRDLALRMDVLDVDDPRRRPARSRAASSLTETSAPVPALRMPPIAASETSASHDEPGAVLDVQQVARLGAVAVDAQLLAEQRAAGEDRDDAALADRALERAVRVERADDRRRQAVGVEVRQGQRLAGQLRGGVRRGGLGRVGLADPRRRASPGRRPCTCS